jgi:hypothetical protein
MGIGILCFYKPVHSGWSCQPPLVPKSILHQLFVLSDLRKSL